MMKYIRTAEELTRPFTGFVSKEQGYTLIHIGPDALYAKSNLENMSSQRLVLAIHHYPPGRNHGLHKHDTWEQAYYVISGQAAVIVGDEEKVVGPGSSAYIPPNTMHDFRNVGDETLVIVNITATLG